MLRLKPSDDSRTSFDKDTGVVRSFFGDDLVEPQRESVGYSKATLENLPFADKADVFLNANKDLFNLQNITLKRADVQEGSLVQSVRYQQEHEGIPVYGAELSVGQRKKDNRIISTINALDYNIPKSLNLDSKYLSADQILEKINTVFQGKFQKIDTDKPCLFIYRHTPQDITEPPQGSSPIRKEMLDLGTGQVGKVYLVWQVLMDTKEPDGNWKLLVDATQGDLIAVRDRRRYATRKGKVFRPDPVRSSQNDDISWSTPESVLNAECVDVNLDNIDDPVNNKCKLKGKWVNITDKEPPELPSPESAGDFIYGAKDPNFQSVMAYYYLDTLINFLIGFDIPAYNNTVAKIGPIDVDPHGLNNEDNSHFVPPYRASDKPYIAYGDGGVPDASDPGVIVHEYNHALHYFIDRRQQDYEEGYCDFLAACWLDRFNIRQFQREEVMPWDQHSNGNTHYDQTRRMDLKLRFDDPQFDTYGMYLKGDIMATALWDIFLKMGGSSADAAVRERAANDIIRMNIETLLIVPKNTSAENLANSMILVDQAMTGGLNKNIIWDAFHHRGLWGA